MTSQNLVIAAGVDNDDGWTFAGSLQNNNTLNAVGHFSGQGGCDIWLRFKVPVAIAQGSTLSQARLRQRANATDSTTTFTARVKVERTANAANVTGGTDLDGRTTE